MRTAPLVHRDHTTWLIQCRQTGQAAMIDPLTSQLAVYRALLTEHRIPLKVILHTQPYALAPVLCDDHVSPHPEQRGERLTLLLPAGPLQLRRADQERGPPSRFVVRVGTLDVRAIAVTSDSSEVAYQIGDAVFSGRFLRGQGTPCTSDELLLSAPSLWLHPCRTPGEPHLRTIEDEREHGTQIAAQRPRLAPDPTATAPHAALRDISLRMAK